MTKNYIELLAEAAIEEAEIALNVEAMADEVQSMVEKLTKIKTEDLAGLARKIKYSDESSQSGDSIQDTIGAKIQEAIDVLTDIKSDIDNETVKLASGEPVDADLDLDASAEIGSELPPVEEPADVEMGEVPDDFDMGPESFGDEISRERK